MALSTADYDFVRTLVRSGSGLVLEDGKAYLASSRLAQVATRTGLGSDSEVVARLRTGKDPKLAREVVETLTVNETFFFRDIHPFETLKKTVLPELVRQRAGGRKLTIWCGACSTGQEPYSIAMILRDHFPALGGWDVQVVATDLSAAVLDRARAGRYSQMEVNRGLPAPLLVKHFDRVGADWVLKPEVRRAVSFRQHNLVTDPAAVSGADVVFLRNVLIYFDVPTKKAILGRVRTSMRPDGYLFLGGSETTWNMDDGFERVPCGPTVFYRPPGAATAMATTPMPAARLKEPDGPTPVPR